MSSPVDGLTWRCTACGAPDGECACGCGGGKRGRAYQCERCLSEAFGAYCYTCRAPRSTTFEGLALAQAEISGRYPSDLSLPLPVGMACPGCGNMMTSMGNGVWRCLNCGYTVT